MPISEEQVFEELKKVIDPELFVNIVDLGLIYTVHLNPAQAGAADAQADAASAEAEGGEQSAPEAESTEAAKSDEPAAEPAEAAATAGEKIDIGIEMTMTSPACPAGPQLIANSKQVLERLEGAGEVEVKIVMDPPWTPDRMTEDAKDQLGIF